MMQRIARSQSWASFIKSLLSSLCNKFATSPSFLSSPYIKLEARVAICVASYETENVNWGTHAKMAKEAKTLQNGVQDPKGPSINGATF